MKLFKHKERTPEEIARIYNIEATRQLFSDKILLPRDYRITTVITVLIVIWAFISIVTISLYGGV
jgi:hypothetical protein